MHEDVLYNHVGADGGAGDSRAGQQEEPCAAEGGGQEAPAHDGRWGAVVGPDESVSGLSSKRTLTSRFRAMSPFVGN